jgi:putative DNA primase/helicase
VTEEIITFGYGQEDFKAAQWLADELEYEWRYDHTAKRWHHWNGKRWAPDDVGKMLYTVADCARMAIAPRRVGGYEGHWSKGGKELGETGVKVMSALQKVAPAERALQALATFPGYGTNGDDWDSDPYLLGVANGIVDLRTNTLMEHPSPDNLVTKTTGVKFRPIVNGTPEELKARAGRFMEVLEEWTSHDGTMMGFLMSWFGASMFGFSPEQRFLLMVGEGNNGKGSLKHAILSAVGEYGNQLDPNLYMRSKFGAARSDAARADLVALKGLRITFYSEPDGNRFNEELLKAHTGGDRIAARALYSNNIQSWDPTHSITFLVNHAPEIEDVGVSMARRVMVADFRERFDGEKEDKTLYDTLKGEAEGILAILCWAAKAWYGAWTAGGGGIFLPERVVEQSKRFMERGDPVAQSLVEVFKTGNGLISPSKPLYDAYADWYRDAYSTNDVMSMNKWAEAMDRKGFRKVRKEKGWYWLGIAPLSAVEVAMRGDDGDESDE